MTLVVRPIARGCRLVVWMCSTVPPQRISSIVDRPTEIPVEVTDPASPFEAEARFPLVNTDNNGPEPDSSPEDVVASESAAMEVSASAWR